MTSWRHDSLGASPQPGHKGVYPTQSLPPFLLSYADTAKKETNGKYLFSAGFFTFSAYYILWPVKSAIDKSAAVALTAPEDMSLSNNVPSPPTS